MLKLFKGILVVLAVSACVAVPTRPVGYATEVAQIQTVHVKDGFDRERTIFVEAFFDVYKDVPLAVFNPDFQSSDDVRKWLGSVFDDEVSRFRQGKSYCMRVVVNDAPVGIAFFEDLASPKNSIYVRQTAVLPNFQNRGIGSQLVRSIRNRSLAGSRAASFHVIVRVVNTRAIAFYQSLGFTPSPYMHEGYDGTKYRGFEWRVGP